MKEFNIVNGKKIHPYVGGVKRSKKRATPKVVEFSPPFKLTLLQDPVDSRDFTSATNPTLFKTATSSSSIIDYTSDMSPVKNQGRLGSCVGFAVAAMKEWQEKKEHDSEVKQGKRDHRKGKDYDYSEAWIYWNCKKIDGHPNAEGTNIRSAMQVLNKIGVPTEKAWPYTDDKLNIGEPKRWASLVSKWALSGEYYLVKTVEEVKDTLTNNGPFVLGLPCFYSFFFPDSNGVIADPSDGDRVYGGHAICAVGFDDERRIIKFKNSWGANWGLNGYAYISYDYFTKYRWNCWAIKDISVTKEMLKESRSL